MQSKILSFNCLIVLVSLKLKFHPQFVADFNDGSILCHEVCELMFFHVLDKVLYFFRLCRE